MTTCEWDVSVAGYLAELAAGGRPSTTIGLRQWQLAHLARGVGVPLGAVSRPVLVSFLAGQRWAPATRRSYLSGVRGFFGWAVANGFVVDDPAARLPVVKAPAGVPRPLPDDVMAQALSAASPRVALMLRCAAQVGLRRAEIAKLHSGDVLHDPRGFSVLVHGKGGRDRVVPLPDGLAGELRRAGGWVFPSRRGGHVSARWVGQECAAVIPAPYTLHSLRHRFATRAYAGSHDLRAVQILLGHQNPAVTQGYVGITDMDLRVAMDAANTEETERE
jgi:integrase